MVATCSSTSQLFLNPHFERDHVQRFFHQAGVPIITQDPDLLGVLDKVRRLAALRVPVLILGETGVGKELIAKGLHLAGPRRDRSFVAVNAAEISDTLGTSLLFGHKKGSFTDAREDRRGLVEEANGGTLFIDEVADLQADVQSQLLRFLDNLRYRPVGESVERKANIRLVTATNKALESLISSGGFRVDLFHRLSGAVLSIPPLRERPGDIPLLVEFYAKKLDVVVPRNLLEPWIRGYWEGNVRQLISKIYTLKWNPKSSDIWQVREYTIPSERGRNPLESMAGREGSVSISLRDSVRNFEKGLIQSALHHCRGNVARASKCLSVSRTTLISKINRLGLARKERALDAPLAPIRATD